MGFVKLLRKLLSYTYICHRRFLENICPFTIRNRFNRRHITYVVERTLNITNTATVDPMRQKTDLQSVNEHLANKGFSP